MPNPKNAGMTGSAHDLGFGLGDMLPDQLSDEEKERKRKQDQGQLGGFGDQLFGSAAAMLLGKGF